MTYIKIGLYLLNRPLPPSQWPWKTGCCSKFFSYLQGNDNKKWMAKSKEPSQKTHVPVLHQPFSNVWLFYYSALLLISISELGSWSEGRKYRTVIFFFKVFPPLAWYCTLQLQLASICSPSSQQRVTTLTHSKMVLPGRRPSHHPNQEQHIELGRTYAARTSVA